MVRLGLSSQAFPVLNTAEVSGLAAKAGLEGIEWAAESHLMPGDPRAASTLLMETLMARLAIASYAALYRVLPGAEAGLAFEALLGTAMAIQSPILRIYAGSKPWTKMQAEARKALADELLRLGSLAGEKGVTVALTLSRGTALEDYRCAEELLSEVDHAFIRVAWEPLPGVAVEEADAALGRLSSRTALILARRADRLGRSGPLAQEAQVWERRIAAYLATETEPKMSRFVLLGRIGEADEARVNEDSGFLSSVIRSRNPGRRP